jgi:hypothetical protein
LLTILPQALRHVKKGDGMFNPYAPFKLALEASRIGLDAHLVVMMRVAGIMGLWDTDQQEVTRMVAEKPRAAHQSFVAALSAAQRGETPAQVISAGMAPIGWHAARNLERLGRHGPRRHF